MNIVKEKRGSSILNAILIALIACGIWLLGWACLSLLGFTGDVAYAGLGENGQVEEAVADPWQDSDDPDVGAHKEKMQPGGTYNISGYKKATWLLADQPGTYTVTGESTKTLMEIKATKDGEITIIFNNTRMVATKDCPGLPANRRSAIQIRAEGSGTVRLVSAPGSNNYFRAKGGEPCIKKNSTRTDVIFDTVDPDDPGVIEAHADPKAVKTSAIGCFSTSTDHNTFGNAVFEAGIVKAYGSENGSFGGGPGIGADIGGAVDGIIFNNATVEAVSGCGSSAAIGTASGDILIANIQADCKNITINGGTVLAINDKNDDYHYGGAGIGGGDGSSVENIKIRGGTVEAVGSFAGAGIGGGEDGDAIGIKISGGTVIAHGGASGIGSGYAHDEIEGGKDEDRFGACEITISQDDPDVETNVEAYGGCVAGKPNQCSGVGIGGWINRFYYLDSKEFPAKRSITITGGKVTAVGYGAGAGIGAGQYGYVKDITITGGIINATGGNSSVAIGGYNKDEAQASCGTIRISGGTILAGDGTGKIGGVNYRNGTYIKYDPTNLIISGGNLHAALFKSSPVDEHHVALACNPISIETFALGYDRNKMHPVESLITAWDEQIFENDYGLNDVYTFPTSIDADPALYFWIPQNYDVRAVKTKDKLMRRGLELRDDDIRYFSGRNDPAMYAKDGIVTVYPQFYFLFDDNYDTKDLNVSNAVVYIGDKQASSIINETKTFAGNTITPKYYSVDKEGKYPLLNPDGTFIKEVSSEHTDWTDIYGKLQMTSKKEDERYSYSRDNQSWYIHGIHLYAIWDDYGLSFDGNRPQGASTQLSGSMDPVIHKYDETFTIPECEYKLPGYKFNGWSVKPTPGTGDTIYQPGDQVKGADLSAQRGSTVTLYAQWEPLKYEIIFDSGEANEGTRKKQVAVFDEPGSLEPNTWTFDQHVFHGWSADGFGSFYEDGEDFCNLCSLDDDGNVTGKTLTADWVGEGVIAIAITRDNRPVTGLNGKIIFVDGVAEFRVSLEYKNGCYYFDPSTNPDAGGLPEGNYNVLIDDEDYSELPEGKGSFFYRSTEKVSVVLDYYTVQVARENDNVTDISITESGTALPQKQMLVPDDKELRLSAEVKNRYHFTGYTVAPVVLDDYTVAGVAPIWSEDPTISKQTITVTGSVKLIAHADPNQYTVQYNANRGSGSMEDQEMTYDRAARLFVNVFSRKGYVYRGWNTKSDGTGIGFDDHVWINADNQDALAPENDGGKVTLYAGWDPITYGIKYDLNGGNLPKGKDNPVTYTVETEDITLVNPEKKDYDFVGWIGTDLQKQTKKVTIKTGSIGDRNYTANWKLKEFKVSFITNGGSKVAAQTVKIHQKAKKPANPKRSGYTFKGWFANKGLTKKYDFNKEITANTSIYAKWKKIPTYTVKFESNGGSKVAAQTVKIHQKAKKPADPKWSGYSFEGWYADKALTKKFDFTKGITKNTTAYAKWTAQPVPVLIAEGKASGKRAVKISWIPVKGASKYVVYATTCGKDPKRLKATVETGCKIKSLHGKKLKKHKPYKFQIVALDKNGKKLAKSRIIHVITAKTMGKYANIKKITTKKTELALTKGESVKLKAKYKLPRGKKHISKRHGPYFRYISDNPRAAVVSENGTVQTKYPGKATIYIQDTSGKYCKVIVTVK